MLAVLLPGSLRAAEIPLSGIVRDATDAPIPDAIVSLHPAASAGSEEAVAGRPDPVVSVRSDAQGLYSLEAPGAGFWNLVAVSATREIADVWLWPLLEPAEIELHEKPFGEWSPPSPAAHLRRPGTRPAGLSATARPFAGRVVSQGSGAPVPGAWVWPLDDPAGVVVSARDGSFVLSLEPGNEQPFAVAARGHETRVLTRLYYGDERSDDSYVRLAPRFTLEGTVEDPQGRPLPEAEVRVMRAGRDTRAYFERGGGHGWSRSRPDGRFTIPGLDPGTELAAVAFHPSFPPAIVPLGDPKDRACAAPGQTFSVRLEMPPAGEVRARLRGPGGAPLAGARAALAADALNDGYRMNPDPTDPRIFTATADTAGMVRLTGLPVGPAVLDLMALGRATLELTDLDVPEGTLDLGVLELTAEALLEVRIIDTRGEPVPGATISASYLLGRSKRSPGHGSTNEVEADGGFRLGGLPGGTAVSLYISADGFLPRRAQAVAGSAEPLKVELVRPARIAGRVIGPDGEGVVEATVTAFTPRDEFQSSSQRGTTDDDGRFILEGLEAGRTTVDVQTSRGYLPTPRVIELAAGETATGVDLVLSAGHTVSGRVLGTTGEDLHGTYVSCTSPALRSRVCKVRSGDDGRFRITGLPPGKLSLTFVRPGRVGVQEIVVLADRDVTLDVVLERGTTVSGRVTWADGEPVPGHSVYLRAGPFPGHLIPIASWADPAFEMRTGSHTHTRKDGSFEITGVGDGELWLAVSNPRTRFPELPSTITWVYVHPQPVVVAGAPVAGGVFRLPPRVTLRGRLVGLAPDELAASGVAAGSATFDSAANVATRGAVAADGTFEVRDLFPGTYDVTAWHEDGRRAEAEVTVSTDVTEVVIDLVFEPAGD